MASFEPEFIHEFIKGQAPGGRTLLMLHGTGGNERDLLELGRALDPAANLLSPRGKVLEGAMPRFFRRLAEGVFDLEDLNRRAHELADFVTAAVAAYGLDGRQVIAVGYSNGANIAAAVMLLRPQVLAGAVLLRAMVPLVPEPLPDLSGAQVYLAAGQMDQLVPARESERLAELLRQAGAGVELRWSPAGHNLTQPELDGASSWLAQLGVRG
jgi:phospholipase/carboxylesterase